MVIADDQPLVYAGFAAMVGYADDLELVGEAGSGTDAVALARRVRPDVILMDIRMPGLDGLEVTRRITSDPELTGLRIIMLTTFDVDDYVYEALRSGASGFLLKDARPGGHPQRRAGRRRWRGLARPERDPSPHGALRRPTPTSPPADRARPAHRARVRGAQAGHARPLDAEIAHRLYISLFTAKTHVSRVLTKLDARDRAQLVMLAYEAGLVIPGG